MKNLIQKITWLICALIIFPFSNFAAEPIKIGAALYGLQGEFMQLWSRAAKEHPAVQSGKVKLTIFDGRYDALVQNDQFNTMITRQFDAIIFVPIDANSCVSSVKKAIQKKIPVIGSNTRCNTALLTSFVGSDDVRAGEIVANHVLEKMNKKGNVVIIEGPIGQSAQIDRAQGINNVLKKNPNVHVLEKRTANWSRAESLALMENWLTVHRGKIDGVIAENDEMALGAIEAIKSAGLNVKDFSIAGVDGITDGLKAVKSGEMESVLQDARAQAQGAIDVALRQIKGEKYQPESKIWKEYAKSMPWNNGIEKRYNVPWTAVTQKNAKTLLDRRQN